MQDWVNGLVEELSHSNPLWGYLAVALSAFLENVIPPVPGDTVVVFTPVEIGIAGERYFEVLDGLQEGDEVVTGPYAEVRELMDGDAVILEETEDDKSSGFSFGFSVSE